MVDTNHRDASGSIIIVSMEDVVSVTPDEVELLPGRHPRVIDGEMATQMLRKTHEAFYELALTVRGISNEALKLIESICSMSEFLDFFSRSCIPDRQYSRRVHYPKLQLHYDKRMGCYRIRKRSNNLPRNNI